MLEPGDIIEHNFSKANGDLKRCYANLRKKPRQLFYSEMPKGAKNLGQIIECGIKSLFELCWAGEKGKEPSFKSSNMWQIVNLKQDKFNFRPCLAWDMGLQPRIKCTVIHQYFLRYFWTSQTFQNDRIFCSYESNIDQFYTNEKYGKKSAMKVEM